MRTLNPSQHVDISCWNCQGNKVDLIRFEKTINFDYPQNGIRFIVKTIVYNAAGHFDIAHFSQIIQEPPALEYLKIPKKCLTILKQDRPKKAIRLKPNNIIFFKLLFELCF